MYYFKRRPWLFLLLMFGMGVVPGVLAQQRTLSGKVVDQQTLLPVADVHLGIIDLGQDIFVDQNGIFVVQIKDTIPKIKFEILDDNYAIFEVNELYPGYFQVLVSDLSSKDMGLSLRDLTKIKVVTASDTEIEIQRAPSVMTVITAQHIEQMGYRDVGDALQAVAGFYLIHDYMQYNLGIRGISGGMRAMSRIAKVMIDGQSVAYRPGSENFLGPELIPLAAIDRIEIIRGPGSALYGANAFLGVINIITKQGDLDSQTNIKTFIEGGEFMKGFGVSVNSGGIINEKLSYYIASSISDFDRSGLSPVNIPGKSFYDQNSYSINDITRPVSFFAKLKYQSDRSDFTIDFNHSHLNTKAEFMDYAVLTNQNNFSLLNQFCRGKYTRKISPKSKIRFAVTLAQGKPTDADRLDSDADQQSWITADVGVKSIDLQTKIEYKLNSKNTLFLGLDGSFDYQNLQTYLIHKAGSEPVPVRGVQMGDTLFMNKGIYFQSVLYPFQRVQSKVLKLFKLTSGIRFDFHNIYGNSINYRIAGVVQVGDRSFLKGAVGTSFKAPSPIQLFSNYIEVGDVIGNPELKPEKAITYEMAWGTKMSEHLDININAFYNQVYDKVELILPMGEASNIKPGNVAEITSAGLESELRLNLKNSFSFINISYQRSLEEKEELRYGITRLRTSLYPEWMCKFGSTYSFPEINSQIQVDGMYIGKRLGSIQNSFVYDPVNYRINPYELPAYLIFNIGISAHFPKFFGDHKSKIDLKVNNVLNSNYVFPGFRDFDIPGFNRSVRFSLIHNF